MATIPGIESKVTGFLRTDLTTEASTTTIDVDFVDEDDNTVAITLQSDTLEFSIDPLNETGNGEEIMFATSTAAHPTVVGRTRLSTVQRGLLKYGTGQTGASATAKSWPQGTKVAVSTSGLMRASNILKSRMNTIYPSQLVIALPVYADATARDAAITSPSNGYLIYNTAQGVDQKYVAGAWENGSNASTANASETVSGKTQLATVAQQGTATSTGSTGARLVMANDNLVKASSGAGDENKIAILGSDGKFAEGFIQQQASEAVATGENITEGNALRMKLDGTIYKADKDPIRGTPQEIITANDSNGIASCQLDTDKIVYIYHTVAAMIGVVYTWDGETYTAGTPVSIDANAGAASGERAIDVISHATDAFTVVQWDDAAVGVDDATAWACTVSGTTITAGSPTVIDSGTQISGSAHSICSPTTGLIAVTYQDSADGVTNSIAGTISGTTITFGAIVEVSSVDPLTYLDVTDIGTAKFVSVYYGTAGDLYARVSTIAGTTVTQGTAVELHDAITLGDVRVEKMEDDKFIVAYTDTATTPDKKYIVVCTVSGTTITGGTPVETGNNAQKVNMLYWEDDKVAICYDDDLGVADTSYFQYAVGWVTATGTVPTIHQITRLDHTLSEGSITSALDGITKVNNEMFQVVYYDTTGYDLYTLNSADNNFIGYANANATAPATVQINFVEDGNQSSLIPGAQYWLGDSGAISLTGLVPAGLAVSATKIIK